MSEDFQNFLDDLPKLKKIAIISHQSPDADAFCSSVALREIIRKFHSILSKDKKQRQKIDIFLDCEEIPKSLKIFVPKNEQAINLNPTPLKKYDLAISLDCASLERMGKYIDVFSSADKTLNIDHHATNTKFAQQNLVLKTSSTCEALYFLFLHRNKIDVSKYILSLLYAGIITDTNNLQNNADALTTEKAMAYIKQNLGISLIKHLRANFFENNSQGKENLRAFSYSKRNRKYFNEDKVCLINLDRHAFLKSNAELEDAEGFVDEALYRKGVLLSVIILEKNKNELFVKLRGKPGVDVSLLAQEFGGGGHERQAGFQFKGKPSVLISLLIPKAVNLVKNMNETTINDYRELFH